MQDIAAGDGDLSRRLPDSGKDELGQVASAFNLFVDKIHQTLSQAGQSTDQLSQAADALAGIARENSESVGTQRSETHKVATAVTEMATTVKEIADSAESAATAAREADREAAEGKQLMADTVQSIDTLATEVQKAADVINRLESDSQAIGSVLDVIRGIAEQTNLLALNAAIEAARAGEQGRGFAVVADEVRTLASRTQESTSEINTMIETLQGGTQDAVAVMNGGLNNARKTVAKASLAGESLGHIVESVSTITEQNTQIATAAEQHTLVAEEIDRSVVRISQLSESAADGSQQTARQSEELVALGEQLRGLVGQFRL